MMWEGSFFTFLLVYFFFLGWMRSTCFLFRGLCVSCDVFLVPPHMSPLIFSFFLTCGTKFLIALVDVASDRNARYF